MERTTKDLEAALVRLRLELVFRCDIDRNSILLTAAFGYLFSVALAAVTNLVEGTIGLVLILSAVIGILLVLDERRKIRTKLIRRINAEIRELKKDQ